MRTKAAVEPTNHPKESAPDFRPEVLERDRTGISSGIVLATPIPVAFVALGALLFAGVLVLFFAFGQYTKRVHLNGLLVPQQGLIKVTSPKVGVVRRIFVREAQEVEAGDALALLSYETHIGEGAPAGARDKIIGSLTSSKERLLRDLESAKQIQAQRESALRTKVESLGQSVANLRTQVEEQTKRLQLAVAERDKYAQLFKSGVVAKSQLDEKNADVLDRRSDLGRISTERLEIERQLASTQGELDELPLVSQREQDQIQRQIDSLDETIISAESEKSQILVAPAAGTVTALMAHEGQTVGDRPLLTLVPKQSTLIAELYAPAGMAGQVQAGQRVTIRYPAFPYLRYGTFGGKVEFVSRAALDPTEFPDIAGNLLRGGQGGYYRVQVVLFEQTVVANDQSLPLLPGMVLEADVDVGQETLLGSLLQSLSRQGR